MRILAVCAGLLAAFFIVACEWEGSQTNSNSFDYDLQGTWERTEEGFWPQYQTDTREKGKIKLEYNTIIITGPVEHLHGFTRDVPLEAYTEDGGLYIKDRNAWQSPVSYIHWTAGDHITKMLTFSGGSFPDETLKQISK